MSYGRRFSGEFPFYPPSDHSPLVGVEDVFSISLHIVLIQMFAYIVYLLLDPFLSLRVFASACLILGYCVTFSQSHRLLRLQRSDFFSLRIASIQDTISVPGGSLTNQ